MNIFEYLTRFYW